MTVEHVTDFKMVSGDSARLVVNIVDKEGVPVDVSNALVVHYAIYPKDGGLALVTKTLLDGVTVAGPVVTILLLPADTALLSGFHHHELTITDADANVFTAFQGWVQIDPDRIE